MHITRCTVDDLTTLQAISKRTFYETFHAQNSEENMRDYLETAFTNEKLTRELEHPHSQFYLLSVEDKIAGYLKINVADAQSEDIGDNALEIERIYVDAVFQKQGLGKVLMHQAITVAQQLGKERIWLGVWEKNDNAIAFYKKQGFVRVGSHIFQMGDEVQVDYILVKTF